MLEAWQPHRASHKATDCLLATAYAVTLTPVVSVNTSAADGVARGVAVAVSGRASAVASDSSAVASDSSAVADLSAVAAAGEVSASAGTAA